jgi:hypothetical protein
MNPVPDPFINISNPAALGIEPGTSGFVDSLTTRPQTENVFSMKFLI